MRFFVLLLFISTFFFTCHKDNAIKGTLQIVEIPTPCKSGGEPNLFVSEKGEAFLSWVEYLNDTTDALKFSTLENDHWSTATTIASGHNWFVNWADFPSFVAYNNGNNFAAHWLQKSASGTYDYDVRIAQSANLGKTWSPSFVPHRDSISAEHGFVTMLPIGKDRIFATWLDGRNTKSENPDNSDHGHGHSGAMSLRTAEFDIQGNLFQEAELDAKICDCCQTDAAITDRGPIVVYRDRSDEEIRDISIVRKIDQDWTQPRRIAKDGWHITGCPVNGPSIVADNKNVAIAWFTAAADRPSVKIVFSTDSGASFSKPLKIDHGNPIGRVDIVFKEDKTFISFLEKENDYVVIVVMEMDTQTQQLIASHAIATTSADRKSGFPILENVNGRLLLAWTQVEGEDTVIKTGWVE